MTSESSPWFVYLLDDELLEKNRQKFTSNTSEAVDLISLFLHHADVLSISLREASSATEKKEDSLGGMENKKVCKLRLMAVKLASLLSWDMDLLNKNLSLSKMYSLLLTLVRICCGDNQPININSKPQQPIIDDPQTSQPISINSTNQQPIGVDLLKLEPHALFALTLHHTWSLNVLIEANMPTKPQKPKSQIPGLVDAQANGTVSKEHLIKMIKENEEESVYFVTSLNHHLLQPPLQQQKQQQPPQQPLQPPQPQQPQPQQPPQTTISFTAPSFDTLNLKLLTGKSSNGLGGADNDANGADSSIGENDGVGGGDNDDINNTNKNNNNNNTNNNKLSHDWSRVMSIPLHEMSYHINWVLANYHFFKSNYPLALHTFNNCQQLLPQVSVAAVFSKPHAPTLEGFIRACAGVCGGAMPPSSPSTHLHDSINNCLRNNMEGLYGLLVEDLVGRELSMPLRRMVQERTRKDTDLHQRIALCNELRGLLDGRGVGMLSNTLLSSHPHLASVLVQMCAEVLVRLPTMQQRRIKLLLLTLSMAHQHLPSLIITSPLKHLFTQQELSSAPLSSSTTSSSLPPLSLSFPPSSSSPPPLLSSSLPSSLSSSSSSLKTPLVTSEEVQDLIYIQPEGQQQMTEEAVSYNVEREMEVTCEVDRLFELATQVHQRHWSSRSYVTDFFEKWRLPSDIFMCLNSIHQLHHISILVHVVLYKARNLQLTGFERAWVMLEEMEGRVRSGRINRLLRHELLRSHLLQLLLSPTAAVVVEKEVLISKCKHCLSPSSQDDLRPSTELVTLALCFLLDAQASDVILSISSDNDPLVPLAQLLAGIQKEVEVVGRCRVLARSLIESVAQLFFSPAPAKKAKMLSMTTDSLLSFVSKLKNPTLLSLLISCLCKLLKTADIDINDDIHTDHSSLWPPSLPSASLDRDQVLQVLQTVLDHALSTNPNHPSWLRTKAELSFALRDYRDCLHSFLHLAMHATDFFMQAINKSVYDEQAYRKMIQSCIRLNFHTIAAVMCQFLEEVDYVTCFKCLQENTASDAMDPFYPFLFDVAVLEFIINLQHKKGAIDRRNQAVELMSRLDMNSHNRSEVVAAVVESRKSDFFRALTRLMAVVHKPLNLKNDAPLYLKYLVL